MIEIYEKYNNNNPGSMDEVLEASEFLGELLDKQEVVDTYMNIQGYFNEPLNDLIFYFTGYRDFSQLVQVLHDEEFFE